MWLDAKVNVKLTLFFELVLLQFSPNLGKECVRVSNDGDLKQNSASADEQAQQFHSLECTKLYLHADH